MADDGSDPLPGLAEQMFAETMRDGQSARRVAGDSDAEQLRARLRRLGRDRAVRVRTARLDQTVVVARVDAELWGDDRATMRAKLAPPAPAERD